MRQREERKQKGCNLGSREVNQWEDSTHERDHPRDQMERGLRPNGERAETKENTMFEHQNSRCKLVKSQQGIDGKWNNQQRGPREISRNKTLISDNFMDSP